MNESVIRSRRRSLYLVAVALTGSLGCGAGSNFSETTSTKAGAPIAAAGQEGIPESTETPETNTPVSASSTAQGDSSDVQGIKETFEGINDADVLKLCGELKTQTFQQTLTFEEPKTNCAWGEQGNMPFDDGRHQLVITARNEQHQTLNLPPSAILCDMKLDFPVQEIRYDDEILLLFNDMVMLASQDYTKPNYFAALEDGLVRYNWEALKGKRYPIGELPNFFIDESCKGTCKIPRTERRGQIKFQMEDATVRRLGIASGLRFIDAIDEQAAGTNPAHRFSFVTTGDNDERQDCMHTKFSFDVKISYVLKP